MMPSKGGRTWQFSILTSAPMLSPSTSFTSSLQTETRASPVVSSILKEATVVGPRAVSTSRTWGASRILPLTWTLVCPSLRSWISTILSSTRSSPTSTSVGLIFIWLLPPALSPTEPRLSLV